MSRMIGETTTATASEEKEHAPVKEMLSCSCNTSTDGSRDNDDR